MNMKAKKPSAPASTAQSQIVAYQGRELRVRVRRGVVLAGGGFSASPDWRAKYLPSPTPQYTRAGEGSTGDTLALAGAVGGGLGEPRDDNAFWFPSSIGRRRDDLFPQQRATAAFDEVEPVVNLVGAIHREIKPIDFLEGRQRNAAATGKEPRCFRGRHTHHA